MLNYRDYAFSCYFAYQSRLTHSSEMGLFENVVRIFLMFL